MPLQNRVTPYGDIAALPGRGLMMGNRGVLHDDARRIVRPWQVRRWITCLLAFRGRKRVVMTPHRYTELFFLDEAAAFAAGHRPCAECRNADYRRFQAAWKTRHGGPTNADAMDAVLHEHRLDGKRKRTYVADVATLLDGTFVSIDGDAWLLWDGALHAWSDTGYTRSRPRTGVHTVDVLTPRPIVELFAAGYRPAVHPTSVAPRPDADASTQ